MSGITLPPRGFAGMFAPVYRCQRCDCKFRTDHRHSTTGRPAVTVQHTCAPRKLGLARLVGIDLFDASGTD